MCFFYIWYITASTISSLDEIYCITAVVWNSVGCQAVGCQAARRPPFLISIVTILSVKLNLSSIQHHLPFALARAGPLDASYCLSWEFLLTFKFFFFIDRLNSARMDVKGLRIFLVADTRLYTLPCRSVGPSVGPSVRHIFEIMTF